MRARSTMLFKGSFNPVSRLYMRMRLSAVLRSMFKFCCIFLLWTLHLSSSKSTSKRQCIVSIDHVSPCMIKQFLCAQHFAWNIIMPFIRRTLVRLKSRMYCTDTFESRLFSTTLLPADIITRICTSTFLPSMPLFRLGNTVHKIPVVFPFRFKHLCIFSFFPAHVFTVAFYLLSTYRV